MKKVLFLAIAALAYAGSANAQFTNVTTGFPTPSATGTSILTGTGVFSPAFGGLATTTIKLRMTTGGVYKFQAKSTNWDVATGSTTWNTTFAGSILKFGVAGGTVSYAETSGTADDGESDLITTGIGGTFDLTIKPDAAVTGLTIQEHMMAFGQTAGTVYDAANEVASCGSAISIPVNTVTTPTWEGTTKTTNNTGDVTANKTAACLTDVKTLNDNIIITLNLKPDATGDITERWIDATLTGPALTFTNKAFKIAYTENPTITLTELAATTTGKTRADYVAGKYTFTVNILSDEVLNQADNRSTLGAAPATSTIDFILLPTPTPTLTTAAIK